MVTGNRNSRSLAFWKCEPLAGGSAFKVLCGDGDMRFTKFTEAEQAEFMELIKDSFDPELYSEDDLPMLRALKKKWEEEEKRREDGSQADETSSEELEPDDWSSESSHCDYE